jgi:type II secretion system protein N
VRCLNARAFFEESPNFPFFRATSLVVKPRIPSFLAREPQIALQCKAYGGDLTGCIDLHDRNGKHPKKSRIEARNIQLAEYEYLRSTSGLGLEGTLFADLEIDGISQQWLDRQGNLRLSVSQGRVLLAQPIFGLDSIDIQDLEISLLLRRGKIDITHLQLKGKDLQMRLLGSIVLEKQIQESRLDLKGEMGLPLKSLTGQSDADQSDPSPFFFAVEGMLAEPKLKIMQEPTLRPKSELSR